jgi:hypothetical protein
VGIWRITYLFTVHGMGAWCWAAVAKVLEREGHSVAIPTLPGLNVATQARAGSFGLADHIGAVSTAIDRILGRPPKSVALPFLPLLVLLTAGA